MNQTTKTELIEKWRKQVIELTELLKDTALSTESYYRLREQETMLNRHIIELQSLPDSGEKTAGSAEKVFDNNWHKILQGRGWAITGHENTQMVSKDTAIMLMEEYASQFPSKHEGVKEMTVFELKETAMNVNKAIAGSHSLHLDQAWVDGALWMQDHINQKGE